MAEHCPYCDSTNIERRFIVKGGTTVYYYMCLDCNRKFGSPIVDPLNAASDAPASAAPLPEEGA